MSINIGVIPYNNSFLFDNIEDFFPNNIVINNIYNKYVSANKGLVKLDFDAVIDNKNFNVKITSEEDVEHSLNFSFSEKNQKNGMMSFQYYMDVVSLMIKYINSCCINVKTVVDTNTESLISGHNISLVSNKNYFLSIFAFGVNAIRETSSTYTLETKGLSRFGYNEIKLSSVKSNVIAVCKRLVRAIASLIVTGECNEYEPMLVAYDVINNNKITVALRPNRSKHFNSVLLYKTYEDFENGTGIMLQNIAEKFSENLFIIQPRYDIIKSKELCQYTIRLALDNIDCSDSQVKLQYISEENLNAGNITASRELLAQNICGDEITGEIINMPKCSGNNISGEKVTININDVYYWKIYKNNSILTPLSIYSSLIIC